MNRKLIVRVEYPTPEGIECLGHTVTVDSRITPSQVSTVIGDVVRKLTEAGRDPQPMSVSYQLTAAF